MKRIYRTAFLDRDGVINKLIDFNNQSRPPFAISEVELMEGVTEALDILLDLHILPVVITNQPDIARGKISLSQVEKVNNAIGLATGIEHFYICPHDDLDNCTCRKPKPGLISAALQDLNLDHKESFLVGDRWKDIEAGQALEIPCFYVDHSFTEIQPNQPFNRVKSLLEAVNIVKMEATN